MSQHVTPGDARIPRTAANDLQAASAAAAQRQRAPRPLSCDFLFAPKVLKVVRLVGFRLSHSRSLNTVFLLVCHYIRSVVDCAPTAGVWEKMQSYSQSKWSIPREFFREIIIIVNFLKFALDLGRNPLHLIGMDVWSAIHLLATIKCSSCIGCSGYLEIAAMVLRKLGQRMRATVEEEVLVLIA